MNNPSAFTCSCCGGSRSSHAASGLCRTCWKREQPLKPQRFCQQCQARIATHNKSGLCRDCGYPHWGRSRQTFRCQQCGQPRSRKARTGLCGQCVARARQCVRCGHDIHWTNRSGYCTGCAYVLRCRLCHRLKDEVKGIYCLECKQLNRQMHSKQRSTSTRYRDLPADFAAEIERRILHYQERVALKLPLFEES